MPRRVRYADLPLDVRLALCSISGVQAWALLCYACERRCTVDALTRRGLVATSGWFPDDREWRLELSPLGHTVRLAFEVRGFERGRKL